MNATQRRMIQAKIRNIQKTTLEIGLTDEFRDFLKNRLNTNIVTVDHWGGIAYMKSTQNLANPDECYVAEATIDEQESILNEYLSILRV